MRTITSRQNPIVQAFRELASEPDPGGRRLLLDGVHLVRDAHEASLDIEVVAVAASRLDDGSEEGAAARALDDAGVEVLSVNDAIFTAMSPVRSPSGVVAIARRRPASASAICSRADAFVLVAVDVQDPGNLGSMLRAAEAGGITGAIVCGASANPFSWKAIRGSMGSLLRLPVDAGLTVDAALAAVSAGALKTVAAVPRGGAEPDAVDWTAPLALLVGGEGPGLPPHAVSRADARVTIPMAPAVESLNVAVSAAILVYAARRQRQ